MTTQQVIIEGGQGLTSRLKYLVENAFDSSAHSADLLTKKQKQFLKSVINDYSQNVDDEMERVTMGRAHFDKIIDVMIAVLTDARIADTKIVELLRVFYPVLPVLLPKVTQIADQDALPRCDILISHFLQITDSFNFDIMQHYVDLQKRIDYHPFGVLMADQGIQLKLKALETAYRMIEAQPYFIKIWDMALFFHPSMNLSDGSQSSFLVAALRHLISPDHETQHTLQALKSEQNLAYLKTLTLNNKEESLKQEYFDRLFGALRIENYDSAEQLEIKEHSHKVMTGYLKQRVDRVLRAMNENIFQHFVIIGEEGSGKMSFLELLSHHFHSYQKQSSSKTKHENPYIVVTLEETFDSKNLVGTYVCNESGEFVFKKGPLTVAAEQGLWLVLRNIEKIPSDLLTFLLPLVQNNELQVSSEFKIVPKLGFRIFALCQQRGGGSVAHHHEDITPFLSHLVEVPLDKIQGREDFPEILTKAYPRLYLLQSLPPLLFQTIDFLSTRLNTQLKHQLLDHKQFSIRQVFKLFSRVEAFLTKTFKETDLAKSGGEGNTFFLASDLKRQIIEEIVDVYLAYIYDKQVKAKLIEELVSSVWNQQTNDSSQLDPQSVSDYILNHNRDYSVSQHSCYFGRTSAVQVKQTVEDLEMQEEEDEQLSKQTNSRQQKRQFVYTAATLRTLEQILAAITHNEATLLVGETGTGKTTQVQQIAKILGKKIHVFNMNQNTDSSDLLGGFKPVDLKFLLRPIYERFLLVFKSLFKSEKNQKFLDLIQKCYEENRVKEFLQCLTHGLQSIQGSKSKSTFQTDIDFLNQQAREVQKRQAKLESGGGFIFQFIEGTLIQSIKNGEWVLLDEINLASEQVLNRVAALVEGDYILLNERADIVETKRHPEFRLFMCMNPPYTSAGKKQLPWSLRSKLTEIYVAELEDLNDLWNIIKQNCSDQLPENVKRKVLEFYMRVREQVFKQNKRANIGLRNLTRALAFMKSAIQLRYPVLKAVYDSLYTCFASHLEPSLQQYISSLILGLFQIKSLPELSVHAEEKISDNYAYVEQFVIPKGKFKPEHFDEKDFVTTNTFKKLLKQLASVVAVTDYAVILQGPTSAGKTSTVQYLANITHNKVIRINNHMHTDIQEYLGSYVPDKEGGGKLVFQEGVLVEAVRQGYWVILDELNLAPSEVLEALNRLLDDNRELLIVETQRVVKAHPNFRIFATQNPTEGYGGRKELSEAFKNRFILINVTEVPKDELELILIHKCSMPQTRAKLMVEVMESLQIYRSQGNIFSGKDSTITVRDLLKWANRLLQLQSVSIADLALEGFLVLGVRSRNEQDKAFIKQTIERVTKNKIDEKQFYEDYFQKHLKGSFDHTPKELNLPKLIQSQQLKRLAVLMHKCLMNQEPVLLVGETGCGKTTLCQIFAALNKQTLFSINCHQNTETSDFIGCMRTRKNLKGIQDQFAEAITHLQILLAPLNINLNNSYKEVIKMRKSPEFQSYSPEIQQLTKQLQAMKEDLDCIFEWHDGILVESMQTGGLLLIDEISLANDSVLERLNSVFEADRTLVLSEKSSKEAIKIKGAAGFNMVATMNPSGDFGKKELSPALRNRMTEIWVESYFLQAELLELYKHSQTSKLLDYPFYKEVSDSIDLFLIIKETAIDKLNTLLSGKKKLVTKVAEAVFNFIGFINFTLAQKYFSLQRKALSIRDILNILDFIKVTLQKDIYSKQQPQIQTRAKKQNASQEKIELSVMAALRNAIELVIIDGLCLGIDVAGDKQKREILEACELYLQQVEHEQFREFVNESSNRNQEFIENERAIGVGPFVIQKTREADQKKGSYAFDADTTKVNLLKLLRAYQLSKPILIEGPPGVGKTSLIENLAKVSGRKLVRVNLSEQTDMMDLLGSEYPVSSSYSKPRLYSTQEEEKMSDVNATPSTGDDEDDIRFHWCDGVLLQALKEGSWFLIDEMNLAQQSVLEGLNALLDHRRTVYIPELNQEFVCHPDFFVFACQNPSQSTSSVGGRKTLPKSFLNRFNKIYLEELTQNDYSVIIKRQLEVKGSHNDLSVELLLQLSHQLEIMIKQDNHLYQDEGTVNMRDLSRFMHLYRQFRFKEGNAHDAALFHAFQICYLQRLSHKKHSEAIRLLSQSGLIQDQESIELQKAVMVRVSHNDGILFESKCKKTELTVSNEVVSKALALSEQDLIDLKGSHSLALQYLMDCLNTDIPILVQTNDPQRFLENLTTLSILARCNLNRLLLNEKSDTSQLLGCFEQTSQSNLQRFLSLNIYSRFQSELKHEIIQLQYALSKAEREKDQIHLLQSFINSHPQLQTHELQHEFQHLLKVLKKAASRFEWVDSILLKAIELGEWVVFENANLCNPSILDRLNPLLEEGNQFLTINEQGLVEGDQIRTVRAHANFRSIFVVSHHTSVDQGKDVSRALKNRCLQLKVYYDQASSKESAGIVDLIDQTSSQKSFDNFESQASFDLAPYQQYNDTQGIESEGDSQMIIEGLGKRRERESSSRQTAQLVAFNRSQLAKYFSDKILSDKERAFFKSYLSFLSAQFQETYSKINQRIQPEEQYAPRAASLAEGWTSFISLKIQKKRKFIEDFFKLGRGSFLNKSAQHFIQVAHSPEFNAQERDDYRLVTYLLLLKQLSKALKLKQLSLANYSNFYLLTQSSLNQGDESVSQSLQLAQQLCHQDDQHIFELISKYSASAEHLSSQLLKLKSSGSNPINSLQAKQLKRVTEQLHEIQQMPLKVCVVDLANKSSQLNRVHIKALMESFQVMLMDDDKQFLKFDSPGEKYDLYMIQEKVHSPYMVLIPNDQGKVLLSQSGVLYDQLNFLKDLAKVQSRSNALGRSSAQGKVQELLKRHTKLPVMLEFFPQGSIESHFLTQLSYENLEAWHYTSEESSQSQLMESILQQENSVNLRDLPAHFLCNTTMQRSISKLLRSNSSNKSESGKPNKSRFRDVVLSDPRTSADVKQALLVQDSDSLLLKLQALKVEGNEGTNFALEEIYDSLRVLEKLEVHELLETLFIIPLELFKLEKLKQMEEDHHYSHFNFLLYHLRCEAESARQTDHIKASVSQFEKSIEQLSKVKPDHEASQLLKSLLFFFRDITSTLCLSQEQSAASLLDLLLDSNNYPQLHRQMKVAGNMLVKSYQNFFAQFNHLIGLYLFTLLTIQKNTLAYISCRRQNSQVMVLQQSLLNFSQPSRLANSSGSNYIIHYNYNIQQLRTHLKSHSSSQSSLLYEQSLKYLLKFKRLLSQGRDKTAIVVKASSKQKTVSDNASATVFEKDLSAFILEHFVRREIAKKMRQEQQLDDAESLIYQLPFKMKMQNIMENNKAMDERTKEDKDKMEKEALLEIEANFPSYFDEFQKSLYTGQAEVRRDPITNKKQKQEIKASSILNELLCLDDSQAIQYKKQFVRLRLKLLQSFYSEAKVSEYSPLLEDQDLVYLQDANNYLREDLSAHQLPSIMNVSEVSLSLSYNFYHDPLPTETRLVYQPLSLLISKIRDILQQWESPILNDSMFLANLIITECRPKLSPVMKVLTGLELIINKLEEWEVYASRSVGNSLESEILVMKQLIIRYRKIQILSWSNLLTWKKNKMIKEDFDNFIRLAHTLERQVFDKQLYKKKPSCRKSAEGDQKNYEIELKVFELLDLFIRDSSLGQFQARMKFLTILLDHFQAKLKAAKYPLLKAQYSSITPEMKERLTHLINILDFVVIYYSQFYQKLQSTIARLDSEAREKVKTLMDVRKWTVQKFAQVKSNIDKTHRQLNKAVNQEEEVLMQNIASLILTSSRKKYVKDESQLMAVANEKGTTSFESLALQQFKVPRQYQFESEVQIIKQLNFLERKYVEAKYPDSLTIEYTMLDIFERIKNVRELNKKHIQRRAFIDLLKYMKDQGLQSNFQSGSQMSKMLIESQVLSSDSATGQTHENILEYSKYLLKSYELLMLLESSSQVDEHADLRNVDIIRIRGFSQSLLLRILQMNKSMQNIEIEYSKLQKIHNQTQDFYKNTNQDPIVEDSLESQFIFGGDVSSSYRKLVKRLKICHKNLVEKFSMISILDTSSSSKFDFEIWTKYKINDKIFSLSSFANVQLYLEELKSKILEALNKLEQENKVESLRARQFLNDQIKVFQLLQQEFLALNKTKSSSQDQIIVGQVSKKVKLLQRYVQLLYQDVLKLMDETHQAVKIQNPDGERKDSNVTDTTISEKDEMKNNDLSKEGQVQQANEDRLDLTIKERQSYLEGLESILIKHLGSISEQAEKIFNFKSSKESLTDFGNQILGKDLEQASKFIAKVSGLIEFIRENESSNLKSIAKFNFITQRIFIYLIYEGFCGQDDKEEENKEEQEDDDKYFEQDGCGMGDGQGGEQNVSNQIEHEEQLEGLKNYESEEEQKPEEKKEEKKPEDQEEENNDFEMEGDFDGELEDAPDQQEEEDKDPEESDEDDAMDEVDELLDNQLWNQNMEDLEQEEDEQNEEDKQREELDLGERNLDRENQLKDQEKELKAGDRDKQEREENEDERGEQDKNKPPNEEEGADEEMGEDEQQDGDEQMPEEDKEEIPLDRDENIVEDAQEQQNPEEDMEDAENQSEDQGEGGDEEEDKGQEQSDDENMEGFEDQHNDQELEEQAENNQDDEGQEEYKNDFNKEVLDNEQIQSVDDNTQKQKEQEQSNLKRQQKNSQTQNQQQNKNKDNQQSQAQELDQQTQFDVNGSDVLYQLAQRIQQQQQQKQQQQEQKERKQEHIDNEKQQVDQPRMTQAQEDHKEQQQQQQQQNDQQDGQAMEYEFDEQAEQLQGKLATDKVEDSLLKTQNEGEDEKMQVEEEKERSSNQQDEQMEDDVQQTQQQVLSKSMKQAVERDSDVVDEEEKALNPVPTAQEEVEEEDLIENYQEYLRLKQLSAAPELDEQHSVLESADFNYDLEKFDYALQKQVMRELFGAWMQDSELHSQSLELLNQFKQQTVNSASSLCEQLRIVLEPQLSQSLQGDYKTGKRLNMKKVISFIASHYRNDKIWLRRTLPSKRDYKILVAIDDSLSMKENNLGFFSLEALVTIAEALNRLEVGKVAVAGIRERLDLFQSFEDGYSNERTAFILSQFNFNYSAPRSADYAMANFVRDTNQLLDSQNSGGEACPFVIVLSDGKFNKNNVRPYLNEAREKKYLYIFVILDQVSPTEAADKTQAKGQKARKAGDGSILSMKSVEKNEQTGGIKLVPYLRDFPFEYYCIVRDIHQLPQALGSILVQWFSLMSGGASGSSSSK